ncbi:Metallo-dependent phosphatase, partial [Linderina pennispora]
MVEWWTKASHGHAFIEPWYRRIDANHHRYTAIFGPAGNASDVFYKINNYRQSTQQYRIHRRTKHSLHRVLVMADNQNGPSNFRRVLARVRKFYGSNIPDTILHVGDSVQTARKLNDWQKQLFSPMEDFGGLQHNVPTIFVPGNHDHDKSRKPNNNNLYTDMYHRLLESEDLGKSSVVDGEYHRFYHSVSVGTARIIVLDAECPSTEQSEFLESELQSAAFQDAEFKIVAIHIPPYIEFWDPFTWNDKGEKHWGEHIRIEYDPLFRKHGVDLVISGHQHNYQRSTIHRGPGYGKNDTITYAIVGGAGGSLDLRRVENYHMYNVTYLDHHFVSLDIEDKRLHWVAHNIAGQTVDEFVLQH